MGMNEKKRGRPRQPDKHGTVSQYTNRGCRCAECKAAVVEYRNQRKKLLPGDDPRHGTESAYTNWGCRCEACKEAVSEARRVKRAGGLPEGDSRHGTLGGYTNYGCRCEACRDVALPRASEYALKVKYGLTEADRLAMWAGQGERCASCGDPETDRRFHIDHDHETGAVRGILCHGCNVSLGHLRDDPERIRALADYIERWRESLPY